MIWQCATKQIDLSKPIIMGVLNVTPDSFSDGGNFVAVADAIAHAEQMLQEGATIIDVGGESTRPDAKAITVQEELDRVLPVIEKLTKNNVLVSVDTSQPEVMRAAIDLGVEIINDVRALRVPQAMDVVANSKVGVCLMHMLGEPQTMQDNPTYENVVEDVLRFLLQRAADCQLSGITPQRIVIDPGFGFGKTVTDNLRLIKQLNAFTKEHYPVLIGVSRKSTIGKILNVPVEQRLIGGLALTVMAIANGAKCIRTHDVAQTKQAIEMAMAVLASEEISV